MVTLNVSASMIFAMGVVTGVIASAVALIVTACVMAKKNKHD